MSLPTHTTQEISDLIVAQLEAAFSQTIPLLPKAFARVLAKVLGGVFVLLYKYQGFMFLQMFVAHATMQETEVNGKRIRPLVEWGRQIGAGDPIDGTQAELLIEVTVQNQTGVLAAGAQLLRAETGVLYLTTTPITLDAPTKQVTVRAASDQDGNSGIGVIGNLSAGDELSFANPLPNVATAARVVMTSVVGADAEKEDAYRARVLRRSRAKPQGGAYADYRAWGEAVAGVANVYPYTGLPGEVDIFVECTDELDADGVPEPALLDAVAAAIELDVDGLASNRPVNAGVNLYPITRLAFQVRVGGLDAPDLDAARTAIEVGLDEYLRSREPFIRGLSVLPRRDRVTNGAVAGVVHEIVSAEGGTVSSVVLLLGDTEIAERTLVRGEKAKLDVVTYG